MTLAFPTHQEERDVLLVSHGIDIEKSFRAFLAQMTGEDEAGVEAIIERAAEAPAVVLTGPPARNKRRACGVLSPRQADCLALRGSGLTNEEVGRRLNLTKQSVMTHVSAAMKALGARNATHAVVIALSLGMVRPVVEA